MARDVELDMFAGKDETQGSIYDVPPLRDYVTISQTYSNTHRNSYRQNPSMREPVYDNQEPNAFSRWLDTFRRDPTNRITPKNVSVPTRDGRPGHYYDLQSANFATANSGLVRELKGRHLQMIAIGGSIGTGLFVASGKSLHSGGPGSVLLAYMFIGTMLYFTVHALGELAVCFPVAGSFSSYSTRFLDPSWGFAMGWKYVYSLLFLCQFCWTQVLEREC